MVSAKRRGLVWDVAAARHAIDFFGHLRHSTGEWAHEPFDLQPWQGFVIGALFGWKRADGLRRFRTAYVEVARKNGKWVMLAGAALYALVANSVDLFWCELFRFCFELEAISLSRPWRVAKFH
ncbi:MAG: terminase large subunit domain-containing protein [Methylocella sp.]